jgi:hypothetical protein
MNGPGVLPVGAPPALVDRVPDESLRPQQPLHRLGPRLPLGEAVLGLQQPTNHQQPAHQVVQGLAGGVPVWVGDHPDQQRVGLAMLLRGHPSRVRHPRPLAKLACAPFPSSLWVNANDLVMANDLDDLDGAEGDPQPPQGRELVIVDLGHTTIMPPSWPEHRAAAALAWATWCRSNTG